MAASEDPAEAARAAFARLIPKAELHIHLEGALEPEDYLALVARNALESPYATADDVRERLLYQRDLNTFIEVYEELLSAMHTADDFYEVTHAYLARVAAQGVVYVEMFFDPQMHTARGIALETLMEGLLRARADSESRHGIVLNYIACFNRDRSAESAAEHLEALVQWKDAILGVGLDNPEEIDFPKKFAPVFARARELGFRLTTHCDVNVPNTLNHLRDSLDLLQVERIDHGLNVLDDPEILQRVVTEQIGLTACPTLLYRDIPGRLEARAGAVKALLEAGALVSVHSDDPGLMRSLYVGDLLALTAQTADLSHAQIIQLAENSFHTAWISDEAKAHYLEKVRSFAEAAKEVR